MADVTIIPATGKCGEIVRTAAYARVSSDSTDQLNSFTVQIQYYSDLLKNSTDAVLVDIYADEGISGTGAEKRTEFQRLMRDCRKGKIDRILTKSVSRFARNTKDCLEVVRELKSIGISVYFEKENIDTAEISSEMLLTMYSVFAQEESLSISRNCRMGIQKRMLDASYVPNAAPYGYRKKDGEFIIYESEANIVKRIFKEYLNGIGLDEIAQKLNAEQVPKGNNSVWNYRTVRYILSNEKYLGDSKYHKWYTTDTLPFKCIENRGEKEMLYAANTHKAIISKSVFEQAQILLKKRGITNVGKPSDNNSLRKKIYCASCGVTFKRRKINGKFYWTCRNHDLSADNCDIRPIPESQIYNAFIRLQNKLSANCKNILTPLLRQLHELSDKGISGNVQVAEIRKEIAETKNQQHLMSTLKLQGILDMAYFTEHSSQLDRMLLNLQNQLHSLMGNDEDDSEIEDIKLLISIFDNAEPITEFDENLFGQTVEKIIVLSNTELKFKLIGSAEFTEKIHRRERCKK